MIYRVIVTTAAIAMAAAVAACGSETVMSPRSAAAQARSSPTLIPIDVLGSNHVPPGQACKAAGYHGFDFWVGNWDVRGRFGGLAGTNVVKSRVGGCVVEENWVGVGGGLGRSLNTYDAAAGTWSQMWVGNSGCGNDLVLIEGTAENNVMVMRGMKNAPNGVVAGPPCFAPPAVNAVALNNIIRWTLLPSGSVQQQFTSSLDNNPLSELPPATSGSGLRYDRVATVTPINVRGQSFCPTRAEAKQFDFMLGTWDIHEGNGHGSQATATFSKDMNDCLVEENVTAKGGYEGLSFNSFDAFTGKWTRTYIDTDGVRLLLRGELVDGSMVLAGEKQGSDGSQVRVSWIPDGANRVVQRWEMSRNGGTDWSNAKELVYTRQ
jgi:hypothetical protein